MGYTMLGLQLCLALVVLLFAAAFAQSQHGLKIQLSAADGLLNGSTTGRILVLFAPAGVDPLDDIDVATTPYYFYGQDVYDFDTGDTITLSGGSDKRTGYGVWGYPNASLDDLPAGEYSVQAFLNQYENATRSDGSQVSLRFPCGDGQRSVAGPGSLVTLATNVTVSGGAQTIDLTFEAVVPEDPFEGTEIGGCSQGNYPDNELLKHVKIRSEVLSKFWNRNMYVGANILLPSGYDANDTGKRYPVIYSQDHWVGGDPAFSGYYDADLIAEWASGIIPSTDGGADRETPKLILVTFRHEAPYYDDSYTVNTANLGPYGDAINDELISTIDKMFNTIAKPYARIQEGGSTGGWESIANVIFRPDLFGACFSSYPDSLDFHRHQDIPLYDAKNAYTRPNGSKIYSVRGDVNGVLTNLVQVEQENKWELTFGTSSRSGNQWDVWNAVFGAQGLNGYPLEPWDKVTGEIYPEAVEYWKPMDLSNYITTNWNTSKNLGEVLKDRIHVSVGTWDDYFLNEGVSEFQKRVEEKGGPDWANFTYLEGKGHGGLYQGREIWDYLFFLESWVKDHAPDGKTPLHDAVTTSAARGNLWEEVIARGGHQAALVRQAPPKLQSKPGWQGRQVIEGSVGRWDPGVQLEAQWIVDCEAYGTVFPVKQGQVVTLKPERRWGDNVKQVQLAVIGRKRGYKEETRKSGVVRGKL
ncbi:hypothetical protein PRZ48_003867 [Zasmidium cellare]|uniref:Uncharacterized protein n=1 Tax=Zasmidium cellare TaxID=395010 RepID=A0ABR0EWB1_ZASCE|nr:hypothetical protein PRZ48_003867 [Zasmidium cellare]